MDTTPRLNDSDNTLLKKICLLLDGAIPSGVLSFNGRTGAISLLLADVTALVDSRYVLKSGDTMTGLLTVQGALTDHFILDRTAADTQGPTIQHFKRGTTGNATGAVGDGQGIVNIRARAWDGSAYGSSGRIQINANGAQSGSNHSSYFRWQLCLPGTTTEAEIFRVTSLATTGTFLSFGGVASTNPALKRNLTDIQVRLGDDTDYAALDVKTLKSSGTQVVDSRKTGWSAATGTATRTTFATTSVTTEQLAQRVKALIDDLISHGLIGA